MAIADARQLEFANPLDRVEMLAEQRHWPLDRMSEFEAVMTVNGGWCNLDLTMAWRDELELLQTTCSFDLRDKPEGEARLSLNVEAGSGPNRVDDAKLAAKQGAAAIAASDGKFLAERAHIRVTGVLRTVPNSLKPEETICWIDVAKIERR